jgi:hypothetical protein
VAAIGGVPRPIVPPDAGENGLYPYSDDGTYASKSSSAISEKVMLCRHGRSGDQESPLESTHLRMRESVSSSIGGQPPSSLAVQRAHYGI